MNPRLRDLIQQLGEAIHESVIESEQIAGVVQNIRRHGFDVMLMLEATIGLNDVTTDPEADPSSQQDDQENEVGPFTPRDSNSIKSLGPFTSRDMNFLKSLRISVAGDGESEE